MSIEKRESKFFGLVDKLTGFVDNLLDDGTKNNYQRNISRKKELSEKKEESSCSSFSGYEKLSKEILTLEKEEQSIKNKIIKPVIRDRCYYLVLLWIIKKAIEKVSLIPAVYRIEDDFLSKILFFPVYNGNSIYNLFIPMLKILALIVFLKWVFPKFNNRISIDKDFLLKKSRGFFSIEEIKLDYSSIASISINRSYLQFILMTGDVFISTGGYGYDMEIKGVSRPRVFVDILLKKRDLKEKIKQKKNMLDFLENCFTEE